MNITQAPEDSSSLNLLQSNNRRRSLFPSEISDSESDSDLGHISPLNFDCSFEHEDIKLSFSKQSQIYMKTVDDYDMIEIIDKNTKVGSPIHFSPYYSKSLISNTPSQTSPSYKHKTPQDSSSTKAQLPKLSRKSLLDNSDVCNKRKLSPDKSPLQSKQIKLDLKSSRVRTALFPEVDFALSTKLFYPKTEHIMEQIKVKKSNYPKQSVLFNTNRKPRPRKRIGQINAGVGHKIRKPKPKRLNKTALINKSLNAISNTAITDYIKDLTHLKKCSEAPKLIENKENADPAIVPQRKQIAENKEDAGAAIMSQRKQITPALTLAKLETTESRKRPLSPAEIEPDPNKKFFKISRAKGIVKMHDTIHLGLDRGKMTLIEKNKSKDGSDNFDLSDLSVEEPVLLETDISDLISHLDDGFSQEENKIILQAHNSVIASENSIFLHQPKCPADIILSPISQMCDVTSGLALNTPKKVKNLTPVLEEISNSTKVQNNGKLFPVFYPGSIKTPTKNEKIVNTDKKVKKISPSQMLLDAGQKKFGFTQCYECNTIYHMGDPSEELMHFNYHSARHVLRFPGWKNEKIVADFQQKGRIVQLMPDDSKIWWKKVNELMVVINQDIGCYEVDISLDKCQAYLYIKKKIIVGCLIATSKSEGYKLLSSSDSDIDVCTQQKFPIKCGIPRIWVSSANRKSGIATEMMNALKRNFVVGNTLNNSDIAISSPTEAGKKFFRNYFKTDSFYIYDF